MAATIERISKEELAARLGSDELQLLDVRTDWKHSQKKIKTAAHRDPLSVSAWANDFAPDREIVLYCSSPREETSEDVARKLMQGGFSNVRILRGGWHVWKEAGLPTQRKEKEPVPDRLVGGILSD